MPPNRGLDRSPRTLERSKQALRPQLRVTLQHLPVLVAGDERDLFDGEACLEQAARGLVAQVMEVKVDDLELHAGARERRAD